MDRLRAQFDPRLMARQRKAVDKGLAKARTRDSMQEVAKLTQVMTGGRASSLTRRRWCPSMS
jgi:hypothetical protein